MRHYLSLLLLLVLSVAAGEAYNQVPIPIGDKFPLEAGFKSQSDMAFSEYNKCNVSCSQSKAKERKGNTADPNKRLPIDEDPCGCKKAYDVKMAGINNRYNHEYAKWQEEMKKKYTNKSGDISATGDGSFADYYQTTANAYLMSAKYSMCTETSRWYMSMSTYYKQMAAAYRSGIEPTTVKKPAIGDNPPFCNGDADPDAPAGDVNPYFDPQTADEMGVALQAQFQQLQNLTKSYGGKGITDANMKALQDMLSPKYPPKQISFPAGGVSNNRFNQYEADLEAARNTSMTVYQNELAKGRRESGALAEAIISGAGQISDPTGSLVYTGVGLGLALIKSINEKKAIKQEQEERERQLQEEQWRIEREKSLIIQTKQAYVQEALNINKYTMTDLLGKQRYAAVLLTPRQFTHLRQDILFTYPILVNKYADDTYPTKDLVEKKILGALPKDLTSQYSTRVLYPITDPNKFINEFIKKMGSGSVIYLDARLLNYTTDPFPVATAAASGADFWETPAKPAAKAIEAKPEKKEKSFWDQ